ncbi:MAG: hypothetical protein OHK0013_06490 [Sandaracinaceae bacterium]
MRSRRVLILYANVTGYLLRCIDALIDGQGAEVLLVHWKLWSQTPLELTSRPGLERVVKQDHDFESIRARALEFDPDVVVTSGWMERDYLRIARELHRTRRATTVCAFDGHWDGTLRQRAGRVWFRLLQKPHFDYAWIPAQGLYQFELARRLGFPKNRVLTGVYSGDQPAFRAAYEKHRSARAVRYPKAFFYVGRFSPEKGVVELYDAFRSLCARGAHRGWKLVLVGAGPTAARMPPTADIEVRSFVQPDDLPGLVPEVGCLVLPSHRDQWGVVVHEFAAAGVPLLVTEVAGAVPGFVKNGYTGFTFDPRRPGDLERRLEQVVRCSTEELLAMGDRATALSFVATPDLWAATLAYLPTRRDGP